MSDYQCHWRHKHDRHEWTPIVPDPDAARVLHVFPDSPIECPGLTIEQVAERQLQADARIERSPVVGQSAHVQRLDGDGNPVGPTFNLGPAVTRLSLVDELPDRFDGFAGATSAGTHDGPTVLDFPVQSNIDLQIMGALVRKGAAAAGRASHSLSITAAHCPIDAPRKRRGLTGKRYRIARRRYAREMRQWRRDGSPMAVRVIYVPHAHIVARDGFNGYAMRAGVVDESAGFPDVSTER